MIDERLRNAPFLTHFDAKKLFQLALATLKDEKQGLLSMDQLVRALTYEIAHVIRESGEGMVAKTMVLPPWADTAKAKQGTVN
jgi:hypothetical protein